MIVIRKETQSVLVVKVHINLEFCGLLCGLNWENSRVKKLLPPICMNLRRDNVIIDFLT
jgi:hypothetical protein